MQNRTNTTKSSNPRPQDGICKLCGCVVKPFLVPGFKDVPPKWMSPQEKCQSCVDKIKAQEEVKKKQDQIRQGFRTIGISTHIRKNSFSNFQPSIETMTAFEAARHFTLDYGGLLFFGPNGVGKTHLAEAIANKFLGKETVLFVVSPEFFLELRKALNESKEKYNILEYAKSVKLLILDDVGAERSSDWIQETMFVLINHRYLRKLPTVITTNLSLDELSNHVGRRVVSRLIEMCRSIKMSGEDWRRKKRTNFIKKGGNQK